MPVVSNCLLYVCAWYGAGQCRTTLVTYAAASSATTWYCLCKRATPRSIVRCCIPKKWGCSWIKKVSSAKRTSNGAGDCADHWLGTWGRLLAVCRRLVVTRCMVKKPCLSCSIPGTPFVLARVVATPRRRKVRSTLSHAYFVCMHMHVAGHNWSCFFSVPSTSHGNLYPRVATLPHTRWHLCSVSSAFQLV